MKINIGVSTFRVLGVAFVVSACGAPIAQQYQVSSDVVRLVHGNQNMDLGDGFDSIADQSLDNSCLDFDAVQGEGRDSGPTISNEMSDLVTTGIETNRSLTVLRREDELAHEVFRLSPIDLLKARLEVGASTGAEFYRDLNINQYTIYLVTQTKVITGSKRLGKVALLQDKLLLLPQNPAYFFRLCGDRFISRVNYGGEYVGFVAINTNSASDHAELLQKLDELLGDQTSNLDEALKGRSIEILPFYRGLRLQAQARPRTVNEIRNTTATYGNQVHRSYESPLSTVLRSYESLVLAAGLKEGEDGELDDYKLFETRLEREYLYRIAQQVEGITHALANIAYVQANPAQFERLMRLANGDVRKSSEYMEEIRKRLDHSRSDMLRQAEKCFETTHRCAIEEVRDWSKGYQLPERR